MYVIFSGWRNSRGCSTKSAGPFSPGTFLHLLILHICKVTFKQVCRPDVSQELWLIRRSNCFANAGINRCAHRPQRNLRDFHTPPAAPKDYQINSSNIFSSNHRFPITDFPVIAPNQFSQNIFL